MKLGDLVKKVNEMTGKHFEFIGSLETKNSFSGVVEQFLAVVKSNFFWFPDVFFFRFCVLNGSDQVQLRK